MLTSRFGIIFALFSLAASLTAPAFVYAATGTVQVGQTSTATGPIVPPSTNTNGGAGTPNDHVPAQISSVAINVSYESATINWSTNELALSRVVWGATPDLNAGSIAGEQFTKKHSALINGLQPHVKYYFSITTIDTDNNQSSYAGEFVTLTRPDTQPPKNISQFTANPRINQIRLSWNNPSDPDFDFVRIVRSEKFFPLDPLNGQVIYEGRDNTFSDTNIVPGKVYYYSGFSRDMTGNYASGSVAFTMVASGNGSNTDPGAPVIDLQLPIAGSQLENPNSFKDFIITYKDGSPLSHDNLAIPLGEDLQITVPKDKLPPAGSFLTLTVKDTIRQNADSTYLFSYDKAGKEYSVTTPAFNVEQTYGLVVTVFNSSKLIIEKVASAVNIVKVAQASEGMGAEKSSAPLPVNLIMGVALVAGAASVLYLWRVVRLGPKPAGNTSTKAPKGNPKR